jgi:bacillithiol biosynthesis deacetylase BshB1
MKVDILAFGAHPDDVELSASGTLFKYINQGKKAAIVDLTEGELGSRGTNITRSNEASLAASILGVEARVNLNLGDGFFEYNQENLIKVVEQIRFFKPEIVFANAIDDRHPDHGKGSKLVSDACFLSGLLKIKTNYQGESQVHHRPKVVYHYIQDRYIKPDFVIDVSEFIKLKFEAVFAYKTQFYNPEMEGPQTPISSENFIDFLKGRMATMGREIDVPFAEGFTVERTIGVNNLFDLI